MKFAWESSVAWNVFSRSERRATAEKHTESEFKLPIIFHWKMAFLRSWMAKKRRWLNLSGYAAASVLMCGGERWATEFFLSFMSLDLSNLLFLPNPTPTDDVNEGLFRQLFFSQNAFLMSPWVFLFGWPNIKENNKICFPSFYTLRAVLTTLKIT